MRPDQLTPNKPRPLSAVLVGARPGSDARWHRVRGKRANRLDVHTAWQHNRHTTAIKEVIR